MNRSAPRVRALLAALALLAACSDSKDDSRASIDSLLSRDLTLASAPSSSAPNLALGDTAASTPRGASTAAAVPASVAPNPPVSPSKATVSQRRRLPPPSQPAQKVATVRTSSEATIPPVERMPAPAVTPAPNPIPATATPASASGKRALGVGTELSGRTTQEICSLTSKPGDRIVVALTHDVDGPDGAHLPAGTQVLVELIAPPAGQPFAFRAKAVQVAGDLITAEGPVRSESATTSRRVSDGNDKAKVVGGAVAGAILGRVLGGGNKGTVIGAAAGGAAGTIAAARSGTVEHCFPAGATLTVTLSSPLVLAPGNP